MTILKYTLKIQARKYTLKYTLKSWNIHWNPERKKNISWNIHWNPEIYLKILKVGISRARILIFVLRSFCVGSLSLQMSAYVCVYIYIYRERERYIHTYMYMHIYIYIYMCPEYILFLFQGRHDIVSADLRNSPQSFRKRLHRESGLNAICVKPLETKWLQLTACVCECVVYKGVFVYVRVWVRAHTSSVRNVCECPYVTDARPLLFYPSDVVSPLGGLDDRCCCCCCFSFFADSCEQQWWEWEEFVIPVSVKKHSSGEEDWW